MKKVFSLILAAVMIFSSLISFAYAVDAGEADNKNETANTFQVESGEASKYICLKEKTEDVSANCYENMTVIINNASKDSNGNDSKYGIARDSGCKNWFAYDVLFIFGKTVLVFLYDPEFDSGFKECYEELVRSENPDYVYFDSCNGNKSSFYVKPEVSIDDIINDSKDVANPGIIINITMRIYMSLNNEKEVYSDNVSGRGFAFLFNLVNIFRKNK